MAIIMLLHIVKPNRNIPSIVHNAVLIAMATCQRQFTGVCHRPKLHNSIRFILSSLYTCTRFGQMNKFSLTTFE